MESALTVAPLLLLGSALVCALPALIRIYGKCSVGEITSEWLENFSVASYRPMEYLLSSEDFEFLSRQPGFDLSLYRKLRRERLRIFRQYLNRLILDFNRLHLATRLLIAHLPGDQSALLSSLVRLRLRFTLTVLRVEASYVLCLFGLRALAVRSLIAHLDEMNAQLTAVSAASGA